MAATYLIFILQQCLLLFSSTTSATAVLRRRLHEPLFPIDWSSPPPPPDFSSSTTPPDSPSPFFPTPPPSQPTPTTAAVVPTGNTNSKRSATPLIAVAATIAVATLLGICLSGAIFYRRRRRSRLPDDSSKLIHRHSGRPHPSSSAEFLYIGTVNPSTARRSSGEEVIRSPYRKLGSDSDSGGAAGKFRQPSPQLQPLPPLVTPPQALAESQRQPSVSLDEESYYTPQRSVASASEGSTSPVSRRSLPSMSSGGRESSVALAAAAATATEHVLPPPPQPRSRRSSPRMLIPPTSSIPPRPPPPPPPPLPAPKAPPPPPLQPPLMGEPLALQPSARRQLLRPLSSAAVQVDPQSVAVKLSNGGSSLPSPTKSRGETLDEETRPRLKPLHWDKVRASSDRAMVWDQLKSSSFQLNEDMFETLFGNSSAAPAPREANRRPAFPTYKQEDRVLDPKKSQNIAILLRALNVTKDEVAEALLDGNTDGLGPELFETLVKMAPTKEEEVKLRDYAGDTSKLGQAERFLKAVLEIPFAFRRVDALLYKTNFETEVNYIRKSFETLQASCEELRSSRLFLKLLDAVLKTGNRMNVGTKRGEASAFKLDTLLKLADVKGADGKTTLLHFVVQEIIRSEGLNSTASNILNDKLPGKSKEDEFRKQGLKVVSGLSNELSNVKKAAGMDSDVLSSYVSKLETGLKKIKSVLELEKSCSEGKKFFETMNEFCNNATVEIDHIKAEEKNALALVKEITEYFHGDAAKEEAHPLRIFMVVRDFLSALDHVCKEVGRLQERAMMGSARPFRISANASLPVFSRTEWRRDHSSDDDSSSS